MRRVAKEVVFECQHRALTLAGSQRSLLGGEHLSKHVGSNVFGATLRRDLKTETLRPGEAR